MEWILLATFAGLCWALTQHIDKYLISKYFKDTGIGGLVIFSSFIAFPVLLIIGLLSNNIFTLHKNEIYVLISSGMLYLIAIVLYLYAMEADDALVVGPLTQFTPLITATLAYFLLDEKLTVIQIIGGFFIITGALILNAQRSHNNKIKLSFKTILLMFLSSFFMAINAIIFKVVAINSDFWTTIFWEHVGWIILGIIFFITISEYRRSFIQVFKYNSFKVITGNVINETITLLGNFSFHYASLLVFIAFAELVAEGSQPIYLILIEILIALFLIKDIQKRKQILNIRYLAHKGVSVLIMILGLVLLNVGLTS